MVHYLQQCYCYCYSGYTMNVTVSVTVVTPCLHSAFKGHADNYDPVLWCTSTQLVPVTYVTPCLHSAFRGQVVTLWSNITMHLHAAGTCYSRYTSSAQCLQRSGCNTMIRRYGVLTCCWYLLQMLHQVCTELSAVRLLHKTSPNVTLVASSDPEMKNTHAS